MIDKKVAIIIVTYNGRQYLPDCLGSVFAQKYPANLFKVIIVDNHSSDSTVGYIQENYPAAKLILNRENVGFTQANNQGYILARKMGAEYVALLNQDTIVEPNWLARLVELAETDERIGAVQAKLLLYPEKDLINSFGNSIHFLGFAFCNHYRQKNSLGITRPFAVPYPSGGACLLRLKALRAVGLFDDAIFMYHDDVDLGWRLRLAGYQVLFDPLAVVYHKYHFSKAKYKFYYMERNRWLVILQNYKLLTLIIFTPALIIMELGIILFSLKNGWFGEKIKGDFWLLMHLPKIFSGRREIRKMRKITDREILRQYTGSIRFQEVDNPLLTYVVNPVMEIYFFLARLIIFW